MAAKRQIIVAVGSANPAKVNAAKNCFVAAFPEHEVRCIGVSVKSGVSDQPWGCKETRTGAHNRAEAAGKEQPECQFAVGMEGGVESADGGGDDGQEIYCSAWMCVKRMSDGKCSYARTGSFELPGKVVALLRAGVELGDADDRVLRKDGSTNNKQKGGTVGVLTEGRISRTDYYDHALTLALIPFLKVNQEFW